MNQPSEKLKLKRPPNSLPSYESFGWELLQCTAVQSHIWEFNSLEEEDRGDLEDYIVKMQNMANKYGAVLVYFFPLGNDSYDCLTDILAEKGFINKEMGYNTRSGNDIAMMYWIAPTFVGTGSIKYHLYEDYWTKDKRRVYTEWCCCRYGNCHEDTTLEFFSLEPKEDNDGVVCQLATNLWVKYPYITKEQWGSR